MPPEQSFTGDLFRPSGVCECVCDVVWLCVCLVTTSEAGEGTMENRHENTSEKAIGGAMNIWKSRWGEKQQKHMRDARKALCSSLLHLAFQALWLQKLSNPRVPRHFAQHGLAL